MYREYDIRKIVDYKCFYEDSIKSYNEFIEMIAKFITEFKLENNSILLSILIRKLLYNGYFSKDNMFKENDKGPFYDIELYQGMDIVNGKGCCRHLAGFHNDLFKKLNIDSSIIYCYVGNFDTSLNEASLNNANHAANLIMFDGIYYTYDYIRDCLLRFANDFLIEEITRDKKPYKFYYKPLTDMKMNKKTYEQMAYSFERLRMLSGKMPQIDYDTYLSFKREAIRFYYNNGSLFGDLRNESKKYDKKICNELKSGYDEEVSDFYRKY